MSISIRTVYNRKGSRTSTYEWDGVTESERDGILSALLGVLASAMLETEAQTDQTQASKHEKDVFFSVEVRENGGHWFSSSNDFGMLSDDEFAALQTNLSAAIAPFKATARRTK